tara:strand:+ start:3879 stop:4202 length:324 start_codon:yes stop_codon:yes gene_type:complete
VAKIKKIEQQFLLKFPLINLYVFNKDKPIVQVEDIEDLLQWDYCDLEGLPPERIGTREGMPTITDKGKPAPGQYENLPKTFFATNKEEYLIEDIIMYRPRRTNSLEI